jgi:hypothetical protein
LISWNFNPLLFSCAALPAVSYRLGWNLQARKAKLVCADASLSTFATVTGALQTDEFRVNPLETGI